MDTVTDELQPDELRPVQLEGERHLLDRPQRLGVLPTWWFWNDRRNWRKVGWAFAILAAATNIILLVVQPPLLHGLAIVTGVMILAIGLLEKYVRHQALKRRALTEADTELAD